MTEYDFLLLMGIMPAGALIIGLGAAFLAWRQGSNAKKFHPGE